MKEMKEKPEKKIEKEKKPESKKEGGKSSERKLFHSSIYGKTVRKMRSQGKSKDEAKAKARKTAASQCRAKFGW